MCDLVRKTEWRKGQDFGFTITYDYDDDDDDDGGSTIRSSNKRDAIAPRTNRILFRKNE